MTGMRLRQDHNSDPEHQNWKLRASCRGLDPDYWEPERPSDASYGQRVCEHCPVKAECLEDALAKDSRYGTYGGLTEWERSRLTDRRLTRR